MGTRTMTGGAPPILFAEGGSWDVSCSSPSTATSNRLTPVSSPPHPTNRLTPMSSPARVRLKGKGKQRVDGEQPLAPMSPLRSSPPPVTSKAPCLLVTRELPSTSRLPRLNEHPLIDVNNYLGKRAISSQDESPPRRIKKIKVENVSTDFLPENKPVAEPHVFNTTKLPRDHEPRQDLAHKTAVALSPDNSSKSRKTKYINPESHSPRRKRSDPTDIKKTHKAAISPTELERRRQRKAARLQIAEKLSRARPDRVAPSFTLRRAQLASASSVSVVARSPSPSKSICTPIESSRHPESFDTVEDDDGGMDWERSRELAQKIREDVVNGRRPILPGLICAESQD